MLMSNNVSSFHQCLQESWHEGALDGTYFIKKLDEFFNTLHKPNAPNLIAPGQGTSIQLRMWKEKTKYLI